MRRVSPIAMMVRTVKATYTPTWDDYLALCDAYVLWKPKWRRARWIHWLLTALVALVSVWLLVGGTTTGDVVFGSLIAAGVVLILLMEFALIPFVRRRAYKRQRLAERVVDVSADESGLDIAQASARSHIEWAGIIRTDRFRHGTVIWLTGRQPFFVPDRGFQTTSDAVAFHAYTMEKIAGATSQTE
ncbi:MAG: hypothetical protein AAGG99_05760 [Pseudomonadota bacterium]